jgi:hypothetical protein
MKRVLLFAALLAWSGLASAVVYKWVDAQGKVQYGDTPPDGVHAEIVEGLGTHSSPPPAQSSRPPLASSTTPTTPTTPTDKVLKEKQEVDQDVAATQSKQCADAQDNYKKLIEGRHIYKTGDNGEKIFLTAQEIDTERLNAKQEVDAVCNASGS